LSDTYKTAKIDFITSRAADIIWSSYYNCSPWGDEINFCSFLHLYLQFFYLNPQPWYQYAKQVAAVLELYFRFRFWPHCHHWHV